MTKGDSNFPSSPNPVAVDAVRWIMNEALAAGKPAVINMSFGTFTEEMDGNSVIANAIDLLLLQHSAGRAVVIGAGNDAEHGFHAAATVPAGPTATLNLKFELHKKDKRGRQAVVLYSGSNLKARLQSPAGSVKGLIDWIASTDADVHSTTANGSGTGAVATLANDTDRIVLDITPATGGSNKRGTWILQLQDSGSTPTAIDALLTFGSSHDDKSPKFKSDTTSRSTLTREAAGFESIAVGSYKVGGKLSSFSARGPTLNKPTGRTKPDLAAPGEDIASAAIASERTCERCCCNCCLDFYVDQERHQHGRAACGRSGRAHAAQGPEPHTLGYQELAHREHQSQGRFVGGPGSGMGWRAARCEESDGQGDPGQRASHADGPG